MAGLRDADAGARQVGFEDGRRGVSRSVGHRPGIQHQGSAATRKSRAVAAPRSARFPREQFSVQVTKAQNRGLVDKSQFYPALPKSQNGSMRQIAEPPNTPRFSCKETAGRSVGMFKRGRQVGNLPHTSRYDPSIMAKYTRGDFLRCNRQVISYMITLADIAFATSCVSNFCNAADLAYAALRTPKL